MKVQFKVMMASLIATLAIMIAVGSAGASSIGGLEEPVCPECLLD